MTYAGEHPWPGQVGHVLVILSFLSAAFSAMAWWRSAITNDIAEAQTWKKSARTAFYVHGISSLAFIGLVLYIILQHYFEYQYVYEHSSQNMDMRYLLVCFWSGQEGSFMLWIFWHIIAGYILMRTSRDWESHTMPVFMLVQAALVTMLLGVYAGNLKLGSSPFALMRDSTDVLGPLWSGIPGYLRFDPALADGRGLNPLLQNYWMILHPPVLFLGFALTLVPFSYTLAGLWRKDYTGWIRYAIPWTFTGIALLGLGILMGGAWAYESLSFGGFWAWDPVENASLVPWLTLVASGHLMLMNRNKPRGVYSMLLFTLLTFILVLYSTFLTRSGILGDTSVHSFTGQDMMGQLVAYLMFFVVLSFSMLMPVKKERIRYILFSAILALCTILCWNKLDFALIDKEGFVLTIRGLITLLFTASSTIFLLRCYYLVFGAAKEEDQLTSREFWMFIAALVLFMSAVHIILVTSLPVGNLMFKTDAVISPDERNPFYNKWQTPFAMVVCFLMGYSQYLKYGHTPWKQVIRSQIIPVLLGVTVSAAVRFYFPFSHNPLVLSLLLFACVYAVSANLDFYVRLARGKINSLWPALAHVGFALIILGSLISQSEQQILSYNYKGFSIDFLDDEGGISSRTDVQLFRGDTTALGDYYACYTKKYKKKNNLYFDVSYYERDRRNYNPGDTVRHGSGIFICIRRHAAGKYFMQDYANWKPIIHPSSPVYFGTPVWENGKPGKSLFTLTPFVQINAMQNVSEPGTRHFLSYDIYTHIKYAELNPDPDTWMDEIKMKGNTGDTLWTAGYKIILSKPFRLDTLGYTVHQVTATLYDHYDSDMRHGLSNPIRIAFDSTGKLANPWTDYTEAGVRMRMDKVPGDLTNGKNAEYEFTFLTKEYMILHAIQFPWISILWIGCILMTFGTLIAAYRKIKYF